MNYRNENANPHSRYEDCVFSQKSGKQYCSNGCGQPINDIHSHGCQCSHARERIRQSPKFGKSTCQRGNECGADNGFLKREAPIGMVYSPVQLWQELYDPHTALQSGTIFKELDLPFYPTPCRRKENSGCQCR